MKTLVFVRHEPDERVTDNLVFAGHWCLSKIDSKKKKEIQNKILPSISNEYLQPLVEETYSEIFDFIYSKLNEMHKVDFELRHWRILLDAWLWKVCIIIEETNIKLQYAKENFDCTEVIVDKFIIESPCSDTKSFTTNWTKLETFRSKYIAEIGAKKYGMNVRFGPNSSKKESLEVDISKKSFKMQFKIKNVYPKPKVLFWDSYLNKKNLFLTELFVGQLPGLSNLLIRSYKKQIEVEIVANSEINFQRANQILDSDKKIKILDEWVFEEIPMSFRENFEKYMKIVEKFRLPKILYTCNALHDDDLFKFVAIHVLLQGGKIFNGQHGGGYGMLQQFWSEKFEREVSDIFLTWGWSDNFNQGGLVKPLGVLATSEIDLIKQENINNGDIVLFAQNYRSIKDSVDSVPSGDLYYKYLDDNIVFVESLNTNERSRLRIRLYPDDYDKNQKDIWSTSLSHLSFASTKLNAKDIFRDASLLVIGYCSTAFLSAIASEVPTVTFLSAEYNKLREEIQIHLICLKKLGIIHDSPRQAAEFINSLEGNYRNWWHSSEVKEARQEFTTKFARSESPVWYSLSKIK